MVDEQENIDEQLLRDWAEMKKLQGPEYWKEMNRKAQKIIRRRRRIRLMRYAAIFILPVLGCCFYFLYVDSNRVSKKSVLTLSTISPGEKKATLYMSNGESVILTEDTLHVTESNGTRIFTQSNCGITYVPQVVDSVEKIYNTLVVPVRGEYDVTLSDGTRVWLNSSSSLKYPVLFSDSVREVYLDGEAFFDVAENKEKPFIVKTKDYTIRVLGTAFNIMDYSDDNYSHTTLVRGKIEMQHDDVQRILTPGEQALVKEGKVSVRKVDVDYYATWMKDRFYFDGESLENIMKKLSRWYGVQAKFRDEKAKSYHFVGSVPKYGNIKDVCNVIELTTHVRFELENNEIIVATKE